MYFSSAYTLRMLDIFFSMKVLLDFLKEIISLDS